MDITITAYQLLIDKRLSTDEINNAKRVIENTGMGGSAPRPILPQNVFKNHHETIIAVVGNVGNYHDMILNNVKRVFNVNVRFIDDEHAQKILDDIDENFLDYL